MNTHLTTFSADFDEQNEKEGKTRPTRQVPETVGSLLGLDHLFELELAKKSDGEAAADGGRGADCPDPSSVLTMLDRTAMVNEPLWFCNPWQIYVSK